MPYEGSVNQTVPSDLTTTSFGELKRRPLQVSTRGITSPSRSTSIRRRPCEHWMTSPDSPRVRPLVNSASLVYTLMRSPTSVHCRIRLFGMSLNRTARSSGIQTGPSRSEEHTSELQSLTNLVCRLLLEK